MVRLILAAMIAVAVVADCGRLWWTAPAERLTYRRVVLALAVIIGVALVAVVWTEV
jgi:hypothetical protein